MLVWAKNLFPGINGNSSRSTGRSIWSLQLLLIIAGLISIVFMFKFAIIPYSFQVLISINVPLLWLSLLSWLSPPYNYLVLNFIILVIAASTTLHHQHKSDSHDHLPPTEESGHNDQTHSRVFRHANYSSSATKKSGTEVPDVHDNGHQDENVEDYFFASLHKDNYSFSMNNIRELQLNSLDLDLVSPPVLSDACRIMTTASSAAAEQPRKLNTANKSAGQQIKQFVCKTTNNHRRHHHHHQQEEVRRQVDELEDDDCANMATLEATWKAITDQGGGKSKLKKSETFNLARPGPLVVLADQDDHPDQDGVGIDSLPTGHLRWQKELRKSETFNEGQKVTARGRLGNNGAVAGQQQLGRDPSMNHDELNRRVEAFIYKFNNEMQIQRQESDQRFLDMINRGI